MRQEREEELLLAVAETVADGREPFTRDWFAEHKVSYEESTELSVAVERAITSYIEMRRTLREYVMKSGTNEFHLKQLAQRNKVYGKMGRKERQ